MATINAPLAKRVDIYDWNGKRLKTVTDGQLREDTNRLPNAISTTVASTDVLVRVQGQSPTRWHWERASNGLPARPIWMAQLGPAQVPPGATIRLLDGSGKVWRTLTDRTPVTKPTGDFNPTAQHFSIPIRLGVGGSIQVFKGAIKPGSQPFATFSYGPTANSLKRVQQPARPAGAATSPATLALPPQYTAWVRTLPPASPTGGWTRLTPGQPLKVGQRYQFRVDTPDKKPYDYLSLPWGWAQMPQSMRILNAGNPNGRGQFTLDRAGQISYVTNGPGADPLRHGLQVTGFPPNATLRIGFPGANASRVTRTNAQGNLIDASFMPGFLAQMQGRSRFQVTVEYAGQSFLIGFDRIGSTNQWRQADLDISGGTATFKPIPGKPQGHRLQLQPFDKLFSIKIRGARSTAANARDRAYTSIMNFRNVASQLRVQLASPPGGNFTTTAQHGAATLQWINKITELAASLAEAQVSTARDLVLLATIDGTGEQMKALASDFNPGVPLASIGPKHFADLQDELSTTPKNLLGSATVALRAAVSEVKKIGSAERDLEAAQKLTFALGMVGAAFGLLFGMAVFLQSIAQNAVRGARAAGTGVSTNMNTWRVIFRDGGVLFRKPAAGSPAYAISRAQAWAQASWGLLDGLAMVSQTFDRASYFNLLTAQSAIAVQPSATSPAKMLIEAYRRLAPESQKQFIRNLNDSSWNAGSKSEDAFLQAQRAYMLANTKGTGNWTVSHTITHDPDYAGDQTQDWYNSEKAKISNEWNALYEAYPWLKKVYEVQFSPLRIENQPWGGTKLSFDVVTLPPGP